MDEPSAQDRDGWLVLADYLAQAGDPLGELIAFDLAEPPADPARRAHLDEQREAMRAGALRGLEGWLEAGSLQVEWENGVPRTAIVRQDVGAVRALACHSSARFIRRLKGVDVVEDIAEAVDAGSHLDRVEVLELDAMTDYDGPHEKLGIAALQSLAKSGVVGRLRELNLSGQELDPERLSILLAADLRQLDELHLLGNPIGEEGASLLAESDALSHVGGLNLYNAALGLEGIERLTRSRCLRPRRLRLGMNGAEAAAVAVLATAPLLLARIEYLDLAMNSVGDDGLVALAASIACAPLRNLDLMHADVGDPGVIALARSPIIDGIEELALGGNAIGVIGIEALASSPYVSRLARLNLESNKAEGDDWLVALAGSPFTATLEELWVWTSNAGARANEAIRASPYLRDALKASVTEQIA